MHGVEENFVVISAQQLFDSFKIKDFLHKLQVVCDRIYDFNHKLLAAVDGERVGANFREINSHWRISGEILRDSGRQRVDFIGDSIRGWT